MLKKSSKDEQASLKKAREEIEKLKRLKFLYRPFRTCEEIKQNGVFESDVYRIDPIGDGIEPSIKAYCKMDQDPPITIVGEEMTETLNTCNGPACAEADNIVSPKSKKQIEHLILNSKKCWQPVKVSCNHNPVQSNPSGFSWTDKDGIESKGFQNVSFRHTASKVCGCNDDDIRCPVNEDCDAQECFEIAATADRLPIKSLRYGAVPLKPAFVSIGKVACQGQLENTHEGPQEETKEIGFAADSCANAEVRGSDAEKLLFDKVYYNHGHAFDKDTGLFVVPVSGLYEFDFLAQSKIGKIGSTQVEIQFVLNGRAELYRCGCKHSTDEFCTITGKRFVGLKKGQTVSVYVAKGGIFGICPSNNRPTFVGKLIRAYPEQDTTENTSTKPTTEGVEYEYDEYFLA